MLAVLLVAGGAEAAEVTPAERERALLVGLCLAAAEEQMRVTPLERVVLLPAAERECQEAPGPTLYKLKGGRVFEWRPMPGDLERSHERQSGTGAHPLPR